MCERRGHTIVCGRRTRHLGICAECGLEAATVLCDGPRLRGTFHQWSAVPGAEKTCSKPICRACAIHVDPDRDYCRDHADPASRRLAL